MRILLWCSTLACALAPTEIEVVFCDLPVARPPDLAIHLQRTVIPHGKMPERHGLTLRSKCDPTETLCRVVAESTLNELYARFQEKKFGSLGHTSGGNASPHYGSRSLELACIVFHNVHRPEGYTVNLVKITGYMVANIHHLHRISSQDIQSNGNIYKMFGLSS